MKSTRRRLWLLPVLLLAAAAAAETPRKATPEALQAWRDRRLGMFIHWGPVSLTEKEISWSRANSNPKCPNNGPTPVAVYDHLYERFDPVKFDAREWVRVAQAAGMKYMVLTAKHCDGFLLWDSKVDSYNIKHTPFGRDVCAELAQAAHEAGMELGWYFSPMDWRDPDFRGPKNAEFVARMQAELTELLSNYGQVDVLWFDWDGREAVYDQANTYALVRRLQPQIMITERLDLGSGLDFKGQRLGPWADFYTPEQVVGGFDVTTPWESCMTISAHNQWAWGGHGDGVKSSRQVLEMLLRITGGDGNLLLNVGPMPSGEIAPEQVERLGQLGAWLKANGDSVYGSRGGPYKPGRWGVSTRKGNTLYLHLLAVPGAKLELPAPPATKLLKATALTGGTVTASATADTWTLDLSGVERQPIDTIVALDIDHPAIELAPLAMRSGPPSLATRKPAKASNVFQSQAAYGPDKAFDEDDQTRWATDSGTHAAWLEVDLGAPQAIGRAVIHQAFPELQRIRRFAIEVWRDGAWQACYQGQNMGEVLDVTFPPVTAQRVRLNITEATDGPTIWEFQLFPPAG